MRVTEVERVSCKHGPKHPFPALVAGPTCCGKSQIVKRLLESGENMIEGAPENIIWCYSIYQPRLRRDTKKYPKHYFCRRSSQ